jgi:pyridoxal phosphate enzyme (YggS family)
MSDLEKNLQLVQQRIAAAAERARRDPRDITLVAVSKTQPGDAILAAHALGAQHFGENRVEEAREKIPPLKRQLQTATWHLIGHLQSRKVRDAVALFDVVQSVDSLALAQRLSERAGALGKTLAILLEVNVSGEATKSGFALAARAEFFDAARAISALPNLDAQGLMTLAPMVANPDDARPYFRALRELRDDLRAQVPNRAWQHLSMGMTDDFGSAIAEGATMVRIGRAIFGERK